MLRIRRKWGEMVGLYRRAINDRPYYIIDTLFDKRQFVGAKDPPRWEILPQMKERGPTMYQVYFEACVMHSCGKRSAGGIK